ncbi:MAG: hypothetical protein CK425_03795 [Parachlamydia sp.]|nr:MAG: hypothetical protein CK425_03795 [Parachlamydia sp.]
MILLSVIIAFFSLFSREIDQNNPAEIAGEILERTATFANKRYPLHTCGTIMGMPNGNVQVLGLCFQAKTLLSRDQLRSLTIKCATELIQQINSNEHIQRFLVKRPFTMQEVQIIIYNKDKNGDEPHDPLIATAQISKGILTFRTTDPKHTYTYNNRFKETYEEAVEIINSQQNKA